MPLVRKESPEEVIVRISPSRNIQGKNHLDSSKADVERNLKEIVINGTESLDGSSIQGEWFPEINADIFISHSRDDADLANGIAGWINSNFNLHCFIDSNVWGYSDELLEKLSNKKKELQDAGKM